MSKIFGEIRQLAFIVEDIDVAMQYWGDTLGIGPFFVKRKIQFSDYVYRGKAAASPVVSIALANSGFMQIELIQQHDNLPSIYKEFTDSGQKGLQHVSSWLTTKELEQKTSELSIKGYGIAQQCTIASSGVKLVYMSCENGPASFIFEMSDLNEPHHYERVMNIKAAYEKWDGVTNVEEVQV